MIKFQNRSWIVLLVLCLVFTQFSFAADKVDLRQANQVMVNVRNARTLQNVTNERLLHTALRLSEDTELKQIRQRKDKNKVHTKYAILYKGVPVWNEQVIITEDSNKRVLLMHGNAVVGLENDLKDVTPAYDAKTALQLAKNLHLAKVDAKNTRKWHYENEKSELMIYTATKQAVLCYSVSFFTDAEGGHPSRPYYILDAKTKEVLFHYEGLAHNGTGPGGNEKTGQYEYGVDFPEFGVTINGTTYVMETNNVKTVNLNGSYYGSTAYSFTGPRNTYVYADNGAYCPLNDAQFFGNVVYDMYNGWFGVPPLTFQLQMRVHYSNNYENAFWNGSSMTFGDGASRFYPLVSLDVSAHEVSHGFTEQNSSLTYSGQSGGINEAFSDMAGEAAEYYMNGTNDWLVGAQIFKTADAALRYMYDPPLDGKSIGHADDYYSGMDVHYSSGVFNKAYYLLGTTDGWNTKMAFEVFTKANQDYWTSSATFDQAAVGVMDAAADYGYSQDDVANAFAQVGVSSK